MNEQYQGDLPNGWVTAELGEILPLSYGKALPQKVRNPDGSVPVYGSSGAVGSHNSSLTKGPALIIGRKGNVGAVFYSASPCWPIDTVYFVETTPSRNLRFFNYLLTSLNMQSLDRSTAVPGLSRDDYNALCVPFPPLPEQARIVEAIETHFTKLDAAVAALERVRANLKRYRACVLKAAVEGRLVPIEAELARQERRDYEPASELLKRILAERRRRWEESQLAEMKAKGKPSKDDTWKSKYHEPAAPNTDDLPDIPEGWCWASLNQLAWSASYGTSAKCAYEAHGEPVLRIPNIVNSRIDLSDLKFAMKAISLSSGDALCEGDFLVIRTNGSRNLIARAALVEESLEQAHFFASYLIRFRLAVPAIGKWLLAYWHAPMTRDLLESEAATSAGQYNVSLSSLSRQPVPLPPLREQERIGLHIGGIDSVAEALAGGSLADVQRCDRLRQSILKWAFDGKLVDQNPSDEPAATLLDRIQAEGAAVRANEGGKRKRGKAAAQGIIDRPNGPPKMQNKGG